MDNGAVSRGPEIHDLAYRGGLFIAGHDKSPWADPGRVTSLVKEGPGIAGLILVVEVSGDIHQVRLRPPLL